MTINSKICGLRSKEAVLASVKGGANSLGFVFFDKSPRNISLEDVQDLTADIPSNICKVGLVINAGDEFLSKISGSGSLDMLQLHGQETPARVAEVRNRFGLQIMKAVAIEKLEDLEAARKYEEIVDWLMFDAKPPKDATRPGGNAVAFDWKLLQGKLWKKPWILAGGLNPGNIVDAIKISGANSVDVSSGVEGSSGVKSIAKINAFLSAIESI